MLLKTRLSLATALAAAVVTMHAHAAGVVEVKFIEPRHFTDAGFGELETARTTQALAEHLKRLGRALPDGQTLRIEVLDVDLAGNVKPGRRGDIRVLRGGADWPRIKLRYTLTEGARTLRSGEETLSDLNYLGTPPRGADSGLLPYEERLLSRWFGERFVAAQAQ